MDFLSWVFRTDGFPARWHCGPGWKESPWLGWLHIISDIGVWSAYLAIPVVLWYFVKRRKDLPFRRVFLLFGAFIFACGTTHLMEAIIFWWPGYRLAGMIKLFTALVSWATVFALIRVVPGVLQMRSPEELEREITARQAAEQQLQRNNAELEQRVAERTAELTAAMAALQDERELLRTTLTSIGDAVISTDPEGRVHFMNGVAENLTGWPIDAARGKPLLDVFHIINESTRKPVENPALRALREGAIVGLANHTILIAQDGTEHPIDDSAAPIRDSAGRIVGAVLVFRDITERKQQEQLLRQSEERATNIVESIADGLITLDKEWRITYLNPRGEEIFGTLQKTDANLRGKRFWDEFPATVGTIIEKYYRRSLQENIPVQFEAQFPPLELWFDIRVYPARDGVSVYFLDITERKLTEIELRSREQQFATLAESIPQLTWMANADGNIFWYNRRWYEYTGTNYEQMQGWGWQKIHDPEILPLVMEKWQQTLATGEPFDMTFPLRGADGVYRPFLTRVLPLKNDEGRVMRWFGTNTDVTEQRRMANELQQLASNLAETDRRKNEFLAMLAHELRNPLAPVRNALEIMKRADGDRELLEMSQQTMERQIAQMVRLIDDLLDISRISRNKLELRRERVELASVLHYAIESCRPMMDQAAQKFELSIPKAPIYLDADPVRLAQVFGNLLANATKYTDQGGKISMAVQLAGSEAAITVSDTGVGIPPPMLPEVFVMFTQIERTLPRAQGGLGIGLTLVKRLVELHNGTVSAYSKGEGHGSTFTVRLPILADVPPEKAKPVLNVKPVPSIASKRILVVDDNRDSAKSLSLLLKMTGHDIRTAHDGQEALGLAEEFRPDVILLDIGMPVMNGYDACRAVRAKDWGQTVQIIALTGWGQDEDRRKTKEAGFDGHLVKPVDHGELMRLLAK